MKSLRLHAVVWGVGEARLRIDLEVTDIGVVVAPSPAADALADVILGLEAPDAGSVWIGEDDVTRRHPGRRGVALVPPGGALLPQLTVERNIAFGLNGTRRARRRQVDERLRAFRLEGIRRLHPHELSPVQRLQVAVVRALGHDGGPSAIVIEDRAGEAPCRAAVATARDHDVAVLVITDSAVRGDSLGPLTRPEVI